MNRWLSPGVLFAALVLTVPCRADIYVCKDPSGVRNFTDHPADPARCTVFLKTRLRSRLQVIPATNYARIGSLLGGSNYLYYSSMAPSGYPLGGNFNSRPRTINQANRKLYAPQVELVARTYGLDPKLMHAVISAESAYNPAAVSDKGAMGLMQLMPDTAKRFGVPDPFDPIANMHGGARYLRWLMDHFQNNLNLVLAAYNAGEGAVERYGNTIPPFEETRTYVVRVLDFYNYYRGVN
jgi:soluble lytic murein transglycosylase-like protein